jgi:WD40-like Beta Propeller Repeat
MKVLRSVRVLAFLVPLALVLRTAAGCGSAKPSQAGGEDSGSPQFQDGAASFGDAGPGGHPVPQGPIAIDDCPGALPAATVTALQAGGPVDPAMRWLYPYDGTVFPGGLAGPVLQWAPEAGGTDGIYVHMHSQLFDYQGCFGPANPARVPVSLSVWSKAWLQSKGSADPLSVELTTIAAGKVSGPIKETWTFALGSLKGSIYYNTYTSPQVANNGAVMRIQPGASSPTALLSIPGTSPVGPCISCHSLSSDGSTMVAQRHQYPPGLVQSESYDLKSTPTPNPASPLATMKTDDWGFSALYPDGSRLITDGAPGQTGGIFPAGPGSNPGMEGPLPSTMYDPKTGKTIPFSGLSVKFAKMPAFSPDGTKLVFNDHDTGGGHSLAVQDFDPKTNAFSNARTIFKDATLYPGWPFFTPDSTSVVFVLGDSPNYASVYDPTSPQVTKGDLRIVDLGTGTATLLDAANGFHGATSYLPYPGRDEHIDFYPTVSPVAAGGYYWVFFTSRRNYGNTLVGAATDTRSKKIWVSAVAIDAPAGQDPSHPAFYLPGQEDGSGNIRAFATLDPCKAAGSDCASGIDCCGGACVGGKCGAPEGCAKTDEKCTKTADCCTTEGALQCINGFCAQVIR